MSRRWAKLVGAGGQPISRPHFRDPLPVRPQRRCLCGNAIRAGDFCSFCLERAPEDLRVELVACEVHCRGSARWLHALAMVENWLRSNPK